MNLQPVIMWSVDQALKYGEPTLFEMIAERRTAFQMLNIADLYDISYHSNESNTINYIGHVCAVRDALTEDERKFFCNGVGSKLAVLKWVKPPHDIQELFKAAADFHDVAYWLGGTPAQKAAADTYFFTLCMQAAYNEPGYWHSLRCRGWAQGCQLAVRIGGEFSFEFRDRPLTLEELREQNN